MTRRKAAASSAPAVQKPAAEAAAKAVAPKKRGPRKKRTLPGDGLALYSVEEVANRLNIGRTVAYRLVGSGRIESFMVSGMRRVKREALEYYVEQCQMLTLRRRSA
jgi:excisionase family DNA binding protein